MGPDDALVGMTLIISAVVVVFALRGPLGKALAERLAGRRAAGAEASAEQVERLVGELDEVKHRLAEAEERLDFTERMLSRQRQQSTIAPGNDA